MPKFEYTNKTIYLYFGDMNDERYIIYKICDSEIDVDIYVNEKFFQRVRSGGYIYILDKITNIPIFDIDDEFDPMFKIDSFTGVIEILCDVRDNIVYGAKCTIKSEKDIKLIPIDAETWIKLGGVIDPYC